MAWICKVFFCFLFLYTTVSGQQRLQTDHHVHIFSEDLLKYIKSQRLLSNSFNKEEAYYTDIDTILKYSAAEKLWLISTGYAYATSPGLKTELKLQLLEHQHLHKAAVKYPNRVEPFYSVNPLKPYALRLVRRAHKYLAFKGIKLHFQSSQLEFQNQGHVRRLQELFSYTGKCNIPVILHFQNHKNGINTADIDFFFNSILPREYKHQLIFAHLGSAGWLKQKDVENAKFIKLIADDHPNIEIKFDLSAILHPNLNNIELLTNKELSDLIKSIGPKQLLFGSDYPLYTSKEYLKTIQGTLSLNRRRWKKLLRNTW